MPSLKAALPKPIYAVMVNIVRTLRSVPLLGKGRVCVVCGAQAKRFRTFGNPPRDEAQCWKCHSLERHRFVWHYLNAETDLLRPRDQKLLHVAPESCLRHKFSGTIGPHYLTADLLAEDVDVTMDITDIHFPDQHFDAIYCSHVLEHVQDDQKALGEFFRVLRTGGWAMLLVPVSPGKTYEDPAIQTAEERLKAFGQEDHVRIYGPDYIDRLKHAGFDVLKISPIDILAEDAITRFGLGEQAGDIFFCRRP